MDLSNIKLVVTDLDRTLLHTDKLLSEKNIGAFMKLRDKGIKTAFATARPVRAVKQYLAMLPCDFIVYNNGALVTAGGVEIASHRIPFDTAKQFLDSVSVDDPNALLAVEINDVMYANFNVLSMWTYTDAVRSNFNDLPRFPADKLITAAKDNHDIAYFASFLPPELYIELANKKLALITHRSATKLSGVKEALAYLGIEPANVLAFGDDIGDAGVIEACGFGVCMANGNESVKKTADFVTLPNDEDGVGDFIERYLLPSLH